VKIVEIERLDTTEPKKKIVIEVYYSKGGVNMWAGTQEPRGYWMSATPKEFDGVITTTTAFSGKRIFIKEVKKFSPKVLEELAAGAKKHEKYQYLIESVLGMNALKLKEVPA